MIISHLFQCLEADVLGAVVCVEDGDVGGGPAARHDGLLLEVLEEQAQRDVAPERLNVHLARSYMAHVVTCTG